jgi:hypothetical protein
MAAISIPRLTLRGHGFLGHILIKESQHGSVESSPIGGAHLVVPNQVNAAAHQAVPFGP